MCDALRLIRMASQAKHFHVFCVGLRFASSLWTCRNLWTDAPGRSCSCRIGLPVSRFTARAEFRKIVHIAFVWVGWILAMILSTTRHFEKWVKNFRF